VEGGTVPVTYDPMLAKLTVSAETRPLAIDRAIAALCRYPVLGIRTNIPFLIRLLDHQSFRAGNLHTGFIDEHLETLVARTEPSAEVLAAARHSSSDVDGRASPRRAPYDPWEPKPPAARAAASRSERAVVTAGNGARWVFLDGEVYELSVDQAGPPRAVAATAGGGRRRATAHHGSLSAPMPATVRKINVAPGTTVKKGDTLLVLEAMKMELPVRAPSDGIVTSISCREGQLVQPGVGLVELE
jgi:acetyl/propionyl-CoA carboxylase alpha subunit